MSYCRFGDADVYAYECRDGIQFYTIREELDSLCKTHLEAYLYAKELRDDHGLNVPDYAIDSMLCDALEDAMKSIVVIGRHTENDNLRELVQDLWGELHAEEGSAQRRIALADRMRELSVEVEG